MTIQDKENILKLTATAIIMNSTSLVSSHHPS